MAKQRRQNTPSREEQERLKRLSESLPRDPQLIYEPETHAEMYYFKKYKQVHAYGKSKESEIEKLKEQIGEFQKLIELKDAKIKEIGAELNRELNRRKTKRLKEAEQLIKDLTGKDFVPSFELVSLNPSPIGEVSLYPENND